MSCRIDTDGFPTKENCQKINELRSRNEKGMHHGIRNNNITLDTKKYNTR